MHVAFDSSLGTGHSCCCGRKELGNAIGAGGNWVRWSSRGVSFMNKIKSVLTCS